jgi:thymidylate synthase (FAD)
MDNVLDSGYLKLIETWGSDERIIESARMSTDKGFQGWPQDEKLLRYLWENKHATPFEMAGATIEVQAPIFVFREWHRHRTQSYNELSARYTPLPDLFYHPSIDRLLAGGQATSNKQSSGGALDFDLAKRVAGIIEDSYRQSREAYELLLDLGVAREISRIVIPTGQYSRMRASANLRNWLAFLQLREAPGAQWEIRQYAWSLHHILKGAFPRTIGLFEGEPGQ